MPNNHHSEVPRLGLRPVFLKNTDDEIESEFKTQFKHSVRDHDVTTSFFGLALMACVTVLALRQENSLLPYYLLFKVIDTIFAITIRRMQGGRLYQKYRTAIVICTRLSRGLVVITLLGRPSQEDITFPLERRTDYRLSLHVVWRLVMRSMLPLLQSFGYRIPIFQHLPLILIPTFYLSALSIRRCSAECSSNSLFYSPMYTQVTSTFSLYKKVFLPTSTSDTIFLDSMNCTQKCILANNFILFSLGCIAPSLVLAAVEEPFRMEVLQLYGGSPIFSTSKALLMYSFFLLPFLAAVLFEFLEIAVSWLF